MQSYRITFIVNGRCQQWIRFAETPEQLWASTAAAIRQEYGEWIDFAVEPCVDPRRQP